MEAVRDNVKMQLRSLIALIKSGKGGKRKKDERKGKEQEEKRKKRMLNKTKNDNHGDGNYMIMTGTADMIDCFSINLSFVPLKLFERRLVLKAKKHKMENVCHKSCTIIQFVGRRWNAIGMMRVWITD
ncbi:hypothetical protein LOAG_12551 [Loa loa]|uniref:Uncharacterized protein n=1 Tax=Loa loa TaxID=7209 RepID=A0A1S0TKZ7_LOALO|nr:hypothetical protein LOAG_12551 [Loa loa]EFO15958.1 hypothetical protein LOAG_12551 [Loa loa]